MAEVTNFLPRGKADVLAYARQMHDAVTAAGFDPASLDMTPADVAELGDLVAEGQAALEAANAARLEAQARTKDLSAPGGTHARLVAKLRAIANAPAFQTPPLAPWPPSACAAKSCGARTGWRRKPRLNFRWPARRRA